MAFLETDMGVVEEWFAKMKEQVAEVIEKEGRPALAKFDAMATEVIKQAKEVQRRTEALAVEAAEAASGAARGVVVKAAAKSAAHVVDAVVVDDELEDEESEENSGDE
jgi:hypothetical protein